MGNKDLKVPVAVAITSTWRCEGRTDGEERAGVVHEGVRRRGRLAARSFRRGPAVKFLPARGGRNGEPPAVPAGTKGRALDHIGFDVADEDGMFKKFADDGVMVNWDLKQAGLKIGFVTDPFGPISRSRRD